MRGVRSYTDTLRLSKTLSRCQVSQLPAVFFLQADSQCTVVEAAVRVWLELYNEPVTERDTVETLRENLAGFLGAYSVISYWCRR